MSTEQMLRLLAVNAYACYVGTLVGNPAPSVKDLGDRMRMLRVGDMVMEVSTIWHEERDGERFGRLLRIADEPAFTVEAWAEGGGGDEPIPLERVYYIGLQDGREYRWHNARFIAIPNQLGGFDRDWHATPFTELPPRSSSSEEPE